jgi:hypothetical protein
MRSVALDLGHETRQKMRRAADHEAVRLDRGNGISGRDEMQDADRHEAEFCPCVLKRGEGL